MTEENETGCIDVAEQDVIALHSGSEQASAYEHVMLDIETLSNEDHPVVLSIGATAFSERYGIDAKGYYAVIGIIPQLTGVLPGRVSQSTLDWWAEQSPDAKNVLVQSLLTSGGETIKALQGLTDYVRRMCGDHAHVWGNGSAFDVTPVERLLRMFGMPVPWTFRNIRDQRTLAMLYPEVDRPMVQLAHHALMDSRAQAYYVYELLERHQQVQNSERAGLAFDDLSEIVSGASPDDFGEPIHIWREGEHNLIRVRIGTGLTMRTYTGRTLLNVLTDIAQQEGRGLE